MTEPRLPAPTRVARTLDVVTIRNSTEGLTLGDLRAAVAEAVGMADAAVVTFGEHSADPGRRDEYRARLLNIRDERERLP